MRHGRICVKPDVAELCGHEVSFADGSREPIDVIVYCSGYRISFPFIDRQHLNYEGDRPELYLNVFHPACDTLAVCGLIQPDSGQFGLVDYQAQLIARFFVALECDPTAAEKFRRRRAEQQDLGNGIRYVRSSRHLLEVEHFSYRKLLKRQIAHFRQSSVPQSPVNTRRRSRFIYGCRRCGCKGVPEQLGPFTKCLLRCGSESPIA